MEVGTSSIAFAEFADDLAFRHHRTQFHFRTDTVKMGVKRGDVFPRRGLVNYNDGIPVPPAGEKNNAVGNGKDRGVFVLFRNKIPILAWVMCPWFISAVCLNSSTSRICYILLLVDSGHYIPLIL